MNQLLFKTKLFFIKLYCKAFNKSATIMHDGVYILINFKSGIHGIKNKNEADKATKLSHSKDKTRIRAQIKLLIKNNFLDKYDLLSIKNDIIQKINDKNKG